MTYQELVEEIFEYYYCKNLYHENLYLNYLLLKDNDLYNLVGKTRGEIFSIFIPFEERETVVWEYKKFHFGDTYKNLEELYNNEFYSEELTYNEWVNDCFGEYYDGSDIGSIIVNRVPMEEQEEIADFVIAYSSSLKENGIYNLKDYYNYCVEYYSEWLETEGITTYEDFVRHEFIEYYGSFYYWYKMEEYLNEKLNLKVEIEYPNGEKYMGDLVKYRFDDEKLYIDIRCTDCLITDYGTYKINVISESLGINYYTEYEYKYQRYMRVIDRNGYHGLEFYDMEQNKSITYEDISKITAIDQGTGEELFEVSEYWISSFYDYYYKNYITKNGTKFVIELTNGEVAEFIMIHCYFNDEPT